jgi:hypothetical protein
MNGIQDDELIYLWRKVALPAPDPEEIAQWVGRTAVQRMDRFSTMMNFLTGAIGLSFLLLLGWATYEGIRLDVTLLGFLCVEPVLAYIWWVQRRTALDPTANSRSYQLAMLAPGSTDSLVPHRSILASTNSLLDAVRLPLGSGKAAVVP